MGCAISTMDTEDPSSRRGSMRHRLRGIVRPVSAENNYSILPNKKDIENGDEGVALGNNNSNNNNHDDKVKPIILGGDEDVTKKRKEERSNNDEENKREKCVEEDRAVLIESQGKELCDIMHAKNINAKNNVAIDDEHDQENKDHRDDSIIGPGSPSFRDYCIDYSLDRSSAGDSNDCDSAKNSSDDDSTNMKNMMEKEEGVNSNKEHEKKEGRGRGIRNALNKGKSKGGRNLLNFGCYNASSESYDNASFKKIVGKTA